jgi:hypothetical protein
MWILIFHLVWPDGDFMDMKMLIMGSKHYCEQMAEEVMQGEDIKQALDQTGATVEWECKLEE